jgi:hypothetical protein
MTVTVKALGEVSTPTFPALAPRETTPMFDMPGPRVTFLVPSTGLVNIYFSHDERVLPASADYLYHAFFIYMFDGNTLIGQGGGGGDETGSYSHFGPGGEFTPGVHTISFRYALSNGSFTTTWANASASLKNQIVTVQPIV